MLNGLYNSTAGGIVQSARQEIIANNLANVNTTGFRRQIAIFSRRPPESQERDTFGMNLNPLLEKIDGGVYLSQAATVHESGPLERTDGDYDFAISGDGFFVCEDANGNRFYTRAGHFQPNRSFELTTPDGKYFLLDSNGRRVKSLGRDDVHLEAVKPVTFEDLDRMRRSGENMFTCDAEPVAANGEVWRGYLEGSNVSPIVELISMIEGFRVYEANMQAIKSQDRTYGRAVNDVGRVNR